MLLVQIARLLMRQAFLKTGCGLLLRGISTALDKPLIALGVPAPHASDPTDEDPLKAFRVFDERESAAAPDYIRFKGWTNVVRVAGEKALFEAFLHPLAERPASCLSMSNRSCLTIRPVNPIQHGRNVPVLLLQPGYSLVD